jgi:hypothetical protein
MFVATKFVVRQQVELSLTLAAVVFCMTYSLTQKMEAAYYLRFSVSLKYVSYNPGLCTLPLEFIISDRVTSVQR